LETFREVAPNVYSLALPLPFELESVNVHLVKLNDGWLLIDCGMETEPAFTVLSEAVKAMGIHWREIHQILLTHMHPDHMGMAARLLELTGAKLLMHEAEAQHLQLVARGDKRVPWMELVFAKAGVPADLQARMDRHFLQIRKNFHDLSPDRLLTGGEDIETAIGHLRVHWTPGHSPGHICLYCPEQRLFFSGDQILEHITPNVAWHPDLDTLADFLESLEGLRHLEIDLIIPSHGTPFAGHREWITQTIQHHRDRCDQIAGLLRETPRTAHNLVGLLWQRQLSPINHHFAIFEVLAHLEYMQRQGRVYPRDQNGAVEWHA